MQRSRQTKQQYGSLSPLVCFPRSFHHDSLFGHGYGKAPTFFRSQRRGIVTTAKIVNPSRSAERDSDLSRVGGGMEPPAGERVIGNGVPQRAGVWPSPPPQI